MITTPTCPTTGKPAPKILEVRDSPGRGRGVFACERIGKGQLIEKAPVIAFSAEQSSIVETSLLYDYVFAWGVDQQAGALALGYGSIYNHDYQPNACYVRNECESCLEFIALREIQPGEEVTINYNGKPDCQDLLWFSTK